MIVQQPYVHDPRHRCCCDSCHVTTGTKIIGIVEAVCLGLGVLSGIQNYVKYGSDYSPIFFSTLFSTVVWALVIFALFWALKTQRAKLLVPFLIGQVLSIVLLIVGVIACIVSLIVGGGVISCLVDMVSKSEDDMGSLTSDQLQMVVSIVGVVLIVVFAVSLIFNIWFLLVVRKCYAYFKELEIQQSVSKMPQQKYYAEAPPEYPGWKA